MAYFVYILQSEKDGSYYIGHTSDLGRRIERHNQGRGGYTKGKLPWKLIYHEAYDSKGKAMIREKEIKGRKNREYIVQLVRTSRA
jgi:putative endonuclease